MRVSARLSRAGVSREKEEERNEGEWRIQPGGVGAAVVYGQHESRPAARTRNVRRVQHLKSGCPAVR